MLLILIAFYAVNVPLLDDWELVPIFQHLHAGHFLWSDFWHQHNEHRILFPNLFLVGLAVLDHWNIIVECFCSFGFAVFSFWILTKTAVNGGIKSLSLLICLSLVFFSPLQAENWLWGWQIEWFMNVLGVVAVIFGLSETKNRQVGFGALLLMIGGGILAQLSLGNGTLIWPLMLMALMYKRIDIKGLLLVLISGLSSTTLYFWNYISSDSKSFKFGAHHPIALLHYVLLYLGHSLSFYHKPAIVVGAFLICTFVGLSTYIFIIQRKVFAQLVPWIVLGLYAIFSSIITAFGRINLGVNEAFSSRYTTVSSLLLISIIVIIYQSRHILHDLLTLKMNYIGNLAILVCLALILSNWTWGVHSMYVHSREQLDIKGCTSQMMPTNDCLIKTYPNADVVRSRLLYVKSIGWGGY